MFAIASYFLIYLFLETILWVSTTIFPISQLRNVSHITLPMGIELAEEQ